MARRLLRLVTAVCTASLALGQLTPNVIPYFRDDTPEDGSIFYSFPGTLFELPTIYAFDDDLNGTANGDMQTTPEAFLFERTGSGIVEGFNPYPSTNPQWRGAPAAVSMTKIEPWTNRTIIKYSFTDTSVEDFRLIPDPYREVCFELRDNSIGTSTWNRRCYRIYVQLAPQFTEGCLFGVDPPTMPTQPATLSIFVDNCPRLPMQAKNVIAIGQEFEGNIYFQDYNRDGSATCAECDQVQITVMADPGLPNGAHLRDTVGGNADTQSPAEYTNLMAVRYRTPTALPVYNHLFSRRLTFTPAEEQAVLYRVCVQAAEVLSAAKQAAVAGLRTNVTRQCAELHVALPDTRILPDPSFAPHSPLPLVDPRDPPAVIEAGVKCVVQHSLVLYEAKDFDMAVVQTDARAGFEQGVYVPQAEEDPEQPLPPGATVGAVERVAVCEDLNAGCSDGGLRVSHQVVSWTPERGMEGREWTSCLLLRDRRLSPRAGFLRRCLTFRVAKCLLCTRHGDTLLSIASDFHTDWLQLWGANPDIANPFDLSEVVDRLRNRLVLGPVAELPEEEATTAVAARFRMSTKTLHLLNPDLPADAQLLPAGTRVCVIPSICLQEGDLSAL